jgi:beta-glucanase (GH16 family)
MRCMLVYLLAALFFISCKKESTTPAVISPPESTLPQFELTWQDDFNGSQLNLVDWYHRIPGVRHDGYNDTTTVSTDGSGSLLIKVYSDTLAGAITHHTGMIATKKEYLYGKFEARVAFSNQSGSWSAFWLQSASMGNPIGNPQKAGMEIDVVETLHSDSRVHHNLHWDGYGTSHKEAGIITGDLGANSGVYHLYTVEWTPSYYKFYVDGQLTWTYNATVSQKAEFFILSSEVKDYPVNSWAGPIVSGGFGTRNSSNTIMKVDYVKYYRLK